MTSSMVIWVVLPAYNEGPRLPHLLDRWTAVLDALRTAAGHPNGGVAGRPGHHYVLVDDGSTDSTPEILSRFAKAHPPADVITHRPNRGLGSSLRDGLRFAAQQGGAGDVIVTMDADNTHPPELLPRMLDRLAATGCQVVIASRFRRGAQVMGLSRLRHLMSFGARVLFRAIRPIRNVRDYTCGYRVYRLPVIKGAFAAYGTGFCAQAGFECSADILLSLASLGAGFDEVPVTLDYRPKVGSSHLSVPRTVLRTLALLTRRRPFPTNAEPMRDAD